MYSSEKITCGFYADNDENVLIGTDYGTLFICSFKDPRTEGKTEMEVCFIQNLGKINSQFEPEVVNDVKQRT